MQFRVGGALYRVLEVISRYGLAVMECDAVAQRECVFEPGVVDLPSLGEVGHDF